MDGNPRCPSIPTSSHEAPLARATLMHQFEKKKKKLRRDSGLGDSGEEVLTIGWDESESEIRRWRSLS